jgi:DNA repair exonuclease SbcCD ATPase subunit
MADGSAFIDTHQALREAIEANKAEEAARLYNNLFSGDPQSAQRFFVIAQMILSGAGGSLIGIGSIENTAEAKSEKERKERTDLLWNSLILSEQIRALEARIEDLNNKIADLSFNIKAKEQKIVQYQAEKSELETQKAQAVEELEEAETRIQEIEDTFIPDLEKAIMERDASFDRLIENSGLSKEGKDAYRTIRETAKDVVTVGIKLRGDPDLDPPPKHVVHRDAEGKLYVLDKYGTEHPLPEDSNEYKSAMHQIGRGEKLGNELDPEELRKTEEAHRIYYDSVKDNPEIRAALRSTSNENLKENRDDRKSIKELEEEKTQLESNVKTLHDDISGYDAKIAELDEKIRLGKIEVEAMKIEREKLALERNELQNQLEEAKLKQQENRNEIQDQTTSAQRDTVRYTSIAALTRLEGYAENIDRFANGEIDLDRLFENAPADIKAKIQDPAVRLQLETIAGHESLSPVAKAELIIHFTTSPTVKRPEPAPIPVETNEANSKRVMPLERSPEAGQLIPSFTGAAEGAPLMSPVVEPNMSPVRTQPAQTIVPGAAP